MNKNLKITHYGDNPWHEQAEKARAIIRDNDLWDLFISDIIADAYDDRDEIDQYDLDKNIVLNWYEICECLGMEYIEL